MAINNNLLAFEQLQEQAFVSRTQNIVYEKINKWSMLNMAGSFVS